MHTLLHKYIKDLDFSGDLRHDFQQFLIRNRCPKTAEHNLRVGEAARILAAHFAAPPDLAQQAGWLHDISAVFPWLDRAHIAAQLGVEVLPEEDEFPPIIHQKLSAVLAEQVFGVTDPEVLSAIACHTTLKPGASLLDKVVFVADKIEWDGVGKPPYLPELAAALRVSLDQAAYCYLDHLWQQRDTLPIHHPWAAAAYQELAQSLGKASEQAG